MSQVHNSRGARLKNHLLLWSGFLLSPLSWWNDALINLPLAYLFSIPFSLLNGKWFYPSFVFGYWLTNLFGVMMMHSGAKNLLSKPGIKKKELLEDILVTLVYTALMSLLVYTGILKAPTEYWRK